MSSKVTLDLSIEILNGDFLLIHVINTSCKKFVLIYLVNVNFRDIANRSLNSKSVLFVFVSDLHL